MKKDEASAETTLSNTSQVLKAGREDVFKIRDKTRRKRIMRLIVILGVLDAYFIYRVLTHQPFQPAEPGSRRDHLAPARTPFRPRPDDDGDAAHVRPLPHLIVRPEQIDLGLDEVKGLKTQVDEVTRSLDVFMGYATFREDLGGNPRRGILFEGPPGTGKTYLAKAMAKQAGVPFLFVSAPAFQSMWFGMTASKIRSYFRALRKAARKEGGAIGFIEEIDAIGGDRGVDGLPAPGRHEGRSRPDGFELDLGRHRRHGERTADPDAVLRPAPWRARIKARVIETINGYLPPERRISPARTEYHNILLIAATNRADSLDSALLRPGRFDRRLFFDLPTKTERRELIDFFLDRKVHHEQLDGEVARDKLAHDTLGYTPVMIEHLFDESLLVALREGRRQMNVADVYEAKLTEEIGVKQPVVYTDNDRQTVASHEAGHATVAYLLGKDRRLEVLSIIKRRSSLGLLAHGDEEERFVRSRSEIETHVAIALGGLVSEEMFFGESGTGPASDLSTATDLAAKMVGAFGMSGSLISYDAIGGGMLDSKNLVAKVLADGDGKQRVEDILTTQKERVAALLEENRDIVTALRDALMERDELVGDEILQVIEKALASRN